MCAIKLLFMWFPFNCTWCQVKLKTKFCGWRKHIHISSEVIHAATFVFKLDIYIYMFPCTCTTQTYTFFIITLFPPSLPPPAPPTAPPTPYSPHPHPPTYPTHRQQCYHSCALGAIMMEVNQQQSWCQRDVGLHDLHMECVDVAGIVPTIAMASIPLQPPESIRSRRTPLYSLWEIWNTTQHSAVWTRTMVMFTSIGIKLQGFK